MCVRVNRGVLRCRKGGWEGTADVWFWLEMNRKLWPITGSKKEGKEGKEMKVEVGGWRSVVMGMGINEMVAKEV